MASAPRIVAAMYHFATVEDPPAVVQALQEVTARAGTSGTLLVAHEGVNGTIAGTRAGIDLVLQTIRAMPGFAGLEHKESTASSDPFLRMKVREKKEIVTLGRPDVRPDQQVGTYVAPQDWNRLLLANDVAVIDTRNDYEVAIGSFRGAVDPETTSFREFPDWWRDNKARFEGKRIAMFCTGGIRCEKASSFLLGEGVDEVFHLKGGILKYLEDVPEEDSLWSGACFVFDQRVSVEHGLKEGAHSMCYACRRPLTPEDRDHPEFEDGVKCGHCVGEISDAQRRRYQERQRQMELAEQRGTRHLGRG